MKNIFITNLGKGLKPAGGRYRTAEYIFPDGQTAETQLLGFALFEWLEKIDINQEKMVILGTRTSMWDALLEYDKILEKLSAEDEKFYDSLGKEVEKGISDESLKKLEGILQRTLGTECVCKVIPYGENSAEQQEILMKIAEEVPENSKVIFDFTHGLRHLPLFALLSVFHLKVCNNSTVSNIYYGAFELKDMHNGKAPVIDMEFALDLMKWIEALSVVENRGNFKPIAEIPGISSDLAENLSNLSFMRATNQVHEMKKYAHGALKELEKDGSFPIEGELYKSHVISKLKEFDVPHFASRQLIASRQALEKDNYLQAVSLAYEALISARVKSDPLSYNQRKTAKTELENSSNQTFKVLRTIRNSLMHGTAPIGKVHYKDKNSDTPTKKVLRMLGSEDILKIELEKYLKNINASIKAKKN